MGKWEWGEGEAMRKGKERVETGSRGFLGRRLTCAVNRGKRS